MLIKAKKISGQILIELIIAITLAGIIISSVIGLFVEIRQSNFASSEQTKAEQYTQEAVQALYSIRERSWTDLVNFTYPAHPVNSNGIWTLVSDSEQIDNNYVRQITIEPVKRNIIDGNISDTGVDDPSTKKFIITISWLKPRPLSITKEIYLTRYQGNTTWPETTKNDFDDGTANNIKVVNNAGGELELDYGEGHGEHTGNKFSVFEASSTGNLDNEDKKVSFRFTAQHTGDVDYIRIYVHDGHPTQPPKYRFGLQSDLNGNPSGVWLGKDHNAYKDYRIKTLGWYQLELEQDADIVKGTPYHLVIEYQSDQINPGKYIDLRTLNPLNKIVPFSGEPDEYLMIRWSENGGLTWTDINKSPVFMLIFEDDGEIVNVEGNPYYNAFDGSVWGANYKGEDFIYSTATEFISRVGAYVYLKKNTPSQPQDDLYLVIKDLTTNSELVNQLFVARDQVNTDYQLKETNFNPPLAMVQGHRYRLYFYSNGTAANRAYQIGVAENEDHDPDNQINYLGQDAKYIESSNSGGAWTEYRNRDTMFRFFIVADTGYFGSGEYVSSSFDAGQIVSFNRLFWTESINPGVTNVELQIATNTDDTTWNFVGPDGTSATRFTNPSGEAIPITAASGRYIRYKAYLTTLNNQVTPIISSVSINYSP